jgi:branched-chain amino acid transport system ATP-binding protein
MALLSVQGLHAAYGDSRVLFGINLEVGQGEVVALLGRNGAGKTTTLSSIMGLVPPRGGRIEFRGRDLAGAEPFEICRAGLGFIAEDCRLFTSLTVAENFEAARMASRSGTSNWTIDAVLELFPDVRNFLDRRASALSGGQQRMVAIARTLDEPSEGLAPLVVDALLKQLKRLKQAGQTVLISEQNLRFANELADRVYIIEKGEIPYQGTPAQLAAEPEVRQKYLMV